MNKKDLATLVHHNRPERHGKAMALDIGCYDGKDSAELAEALNGTVYCFEPDPLTAELFRSLHVNNPRLILQEMAIGDMDGLVTYHRSNHPQSNSLLEPKEHLNLFPGIHFDEEAKVRCMRLDTWYSRRGEGKVIDLIWADVNGAEEKLILGGLKALMRTRYLYIECARKELYKGQRTYEPGSRENLLSSLLPGFKIIQHYNWGASFGNVLLKNKALE